MGGVNLHCQVIVNPSAGRGDVSKFIPQLREMLSRKGISFELVVTRSPGHAIELAREGTKQFQTIVAVGGDGTINEVVNGIMGTDAVLGIIPLGTGNDLARSLKIPFSLEKSVQTLTSGRTVSIDVGKDIDGYFTDILGIGFPSDVMFHANTSTSRFRGTTAIKASIIQVINKLQPYQVMIETDQGQFSATVMGVFILNTPYTGGGVNLAPDASMDDGAFDVVIMNEMRKLEFLRLLPKSYKGKHVGSPNVRIIRTSKIKITTVTPMRKNFDGNIIGITPIDAQVLPLALRVIVPGK